VTERSDKATSEAAITRRAFLGHTAALSGAVTVPWIVPASARGSQENVAASERITMGLIGHGLMGRGHLRRLAGDREVQVLAVEQTYAARTPGGAYSGCAAYNDYRELLARDDIDAVVIATPDHWHTPASIDAAKAGKDVYCEKPISITIGQGRRLAETMRQYGRIFQTGTQYRSIPTIRRVCEFVRGGGLGKVKSAFTLWSSLAGAFGPVPLVSSHTPRCGTMRRSGVPTCRWISPSRPSRCPRGWTGTCGWGRPPGIPTTASTT